jgi:CO dehydrogenase/acetyl-CoA synthase beta subunit
LSRDTLPNNFRLNYGGLDYVGPGIYAMVESATAVRRRQDGSFTEMFTHNTTDVTQIRHNCVEKLQFYLTDVKAFDHPIAVLPNVVGWGGGS